MEEEQEDDLHIDEGDDIDGALIDQMANIPRE